MKAVVFRDVGEIELTDVEEPKIQSPLDAIVRVTTSAICGTDLHMVRGTMPGMREGTILGHEGVGIVEELGQDVRNLEVGDRVVIPSTIGCGYCSYCRAGYFSQCDNSNPMGHLSGPTFYGGPAASGGYHGLQAEKARIPFANVGLVKLPDEISDADGILLSDVFPTGFFGARLAEIKAGDAVAVFGCGPVGQFAIQSALLMDAGRVFAIDNVQSRLAMARRQGAEVINFDEDDPVQILRELTGGIGVDRAIDAVGVDASCPHTGPAATPCEKWTKENKAEVREISEDKLAVHPWHPGDAPSQALRWAVDGLAKAGSLGIIGVYPQTDRFFPIGQSMMKNLTVHAGTCNHRAHIPHLLGLVRSGMVIPSQIVNQHEPFKSVIEAYHAFDEKKPGWIKVDLDVAG